MVPSCGSVAVAVTVKFSFHSYMPPPGSDVIRSVGLSLPTTMGIVVVPERPVPSLTVRRAWKLPFCV
jgi:hypothetical protein